MALIAKERTFQELIPAEVKIAVSSLADKPTNNDPTIRLFYKAVERKINDAERLSRTFGMGANDQFIKGLMDVTQHRLDTTSPDFIAKFIFQAYQYTNWSTNGYQNNLDSPSLFTTAPDYIKIPTAGGWAERLSKDFTDPNDREKPSQFNQIWTDTIKTATIPTTIPQRYAGIRALLVQRFGDQPISIADFGTGTGNGLRTLVSNTPFETLDRDDTKGTVSSLMNQPVNIERATGIDLHDFTRSDSRLLAMACRYTPSEFHKITEDMAEERELRAKTPNVEFKQGDILTDDNLLTKKVKVISIPTVLYQLPTQDDRWRFVRRAASYLEPDGMLIAQDFAIPEAGNPENPLGLRFGQPWDKYYTYVLPKDGGFESPQQVFVWAGGRCREVEPGEDFNRYFGIRN